MTPPASFYRPYPATYPTEIEDVIVKIREYAFLNRWTDFHDYFSAFRHSGDQPSLAICLEAIQVYMIYGRLDHAIATLEDFGMEDYLHDLSVVFEEQWAIALMLKAQLDAESSHQYTDLLKVTNMIEGLYVTCSGSSMSFELPSYFRLQSAAAFRGMLSDPSSLSLSLDALSDVRICLELQLIQCHYRLERWGLTHGRLRPHAEARLPPLIHQLRSQGRKLMEAECIFVLSPDNFCGTLTKALIFLEAYLETITAPDLTYLRSVARSWIAGMLADSDHELSRLRFDEAVIEDHEPVTLLGRMAAEVRIYQKSTMLTGERFDQCSALYKSYAELDYVTHEHSMLELMIECARSDHSLIDRVMEIAEPMLRRLKSTKNNNLRKETLCGIGNILVTYAPRSEQGREYLETLRSESDENHPKLCANICEGLVAGYHALGDYEGAFSISQEWMRCSWCRMYEIQMSLAVCQHGEVLWNCVESRSSSSIDDLTARDRQLLVEGVALLEAWTEIDRKGTQVPKSPHQALLRWKARTLQRLLSVLRIVDKAEETQAKFEHWTGIVAEGAAAQLETSLDRRALPEVCERMIDDQNFSGLLELLQAQISRLDDEQALSPGTEATTIQNILRALQTTFERLPPVLELQGVIRTAYAIMLRTLKDGLSVLKVGRYVNEYLDSCDLTCRIVRSCLSVDPNRSEELFRIIKDYLADAEVMCRQIRQTVLSRHSLQSWLKTRQVVGTNRLVSVYSKGVETFIRMDDSWLAWNFLQKLRARGLSDMLLEKETVSNGLLESIAHTSSARESWQDNIKLVCRDDYASEKEYTAALWLEGDISKRYSGNQSIRLLLEDPEYPTPVWNELQDIWVIGKYLPEDSNVVLVDWFVGASGTIYLFVLGSSGQVKTPHWVRSGASLADIRRWNSTYLHFPTDEDRPLEYVRSMYDLRPLLAGIEEASKPGDLLIFIPSAEISRIPLHAIPLGTSAKKPIISRNPVVYASSVAQLRHTIRKQTLRSGRTTSPLQNAFFCAAYEEERFKRERQDIITQVKQISQNFGGTDVTGSNLTAKTMKSSLEAGSWLHYHGHCDYAADNVLEQSLTLAEERQYFDNESRAHTNLPDARCIQDTEETTPISLDEVATIFKKCSKLTIADIFAMDLRQNCPVVCMIACDSGVQEVNKGGEPLGLVAALFCAGAVSVIGTLWPIASKIGREFSAKFYEHLHLQLQRSGRGTRCVLDLSSAFREATLHVKKLDDRPLAWAAFTLNGAGFA